MLDSLNKFSDKDMFPYLPTFVYMAVNSKKYIFHKFLNTLAMKSIPFYLSIRWSYTTYIDDREELEKYRNKLDANFINHLSTPTQEMPL